MRSLRHLFPAALVAVLVAMGSASAYVMDPATLESLLDSNTGPGRPGIDQIGEVSHIANIGGFGGTDIEFASREVIKLSEGATGDPVCVPDDNEPDGCAKDADGEIIFETEIRDFAVAGAWGNTAGGSGGGNARVIDVTDPTTPVVVAIAPCRASQNDVQIQGDILLAAQDSGSGSCTRTDGTPQSFQGTALMDFSDPRAPTFLSRITYGRGSHNHTFHPTEPLIYLSDSDVASAGLGNVPIWDVSDPLNPTMVTEFKHLAHSPHDITFNADGSRAYVAAVSATYILNTEDPRAPTVIATIANEGISISHQADPTPDGNFLLVSDELGGGAAGLAPGGPVHVYDITNEVTPVKVGVIENNCLPQTCHELTDIPPTSTAHVFRINPDGYTMAIGWYKDGMFVIDYSDVFGANAAGSGEATGLFGRVIAAMRMPNANTWSAKMWQEKHPGYVFTNGQRRGFDVFYVPELDDGFYGTGAIRAGGPHTSPVGGVTEHTFSTVGGCAGRPANQGLDGYVYPNIPDELGDGTHRIDLSVVAGQAADLTIWLYDQGCTLMNTTGLTSGSTILEGAKHIVVNGFTGAAVRFNTYIR